MGRSRENEREGGNIKGGREGGGREATRGREKGKEIN